MVEKKNRKALVMNNEKIGKGLQKLLESSREEITLERVPMEIDEYLQRCLIEFCRKLHSGPLSNIFDKSSVEELSYSIFKPTIELEIIKRLPRYVQKINEETRIGIDDIVRGYIEDLNK
jgi:hypothetical protein